MVFFKYLLRFVSRSWTFKTSDHVASDFCEFGVSLDDRYIVQCNLTCTTHATGRPVGIGNEKSYPIQLSVFTKLCIDIICACNAN
ncbi:hypothetical protein EYC84_010293 [Monilinia fructicola]|uniref:Uncharacterized protein n=1 Tax=Monilinia fructicola TaxID=38448 RepID=A0A5M9JCB7_MONFR|nr:hypothetical protein EYC84_010293 [Monilinia fructicola]